MKERKYIVGLDQSDRLILRAGYVIYHKDLINITKSSSGFSENYDVIPLGGGFWKVESDEIWLYGSSSDFGKPQGLEEALKVDGNHFRQQITEAERWIQSDDSINCLEFPIVYVNEIGEKIYPEIDQAPEPKEKIAQVVTAADRQVKSIIPEQSRGTNRTPSTKGIAKAKKAKRRATKKHYGKHK